MSETLSIFDLIASVDAMPLCPPVSQAQAAAASPAESAAVPTPAFSAAADGEEPFTLQTESDTMTFYEADGFGVGVQKIYDYIIDDNVRLKKIFELYSRPAAKAQVEPLRTAPLAPAAESSPAHDIDAADESPCPPEETANETADIESDLSAEELSSGDDEELQIAFPPEARSDFGLKGDSGNSSELYPAAEEEGDEKGTLTQNTAGTELFIESDSSEVPELFYEEEPASAVYTGEGAGMGVYNGEKGTSGTPPADDDTISKTEPAEIPPSKNTNSPNEPAASPAAESDLLLDQGDVNFESSMLDDSVESVDIDDEWYEQQQPTRESLETHHYSMHSPVSHYPLGEDELEDIEADIEAEPSLIIEERLDDIYERLSECRRTGIDITDSVILLDSDRDIERLLNTKTPLGSTDLKKLLNHFDQLIGKLPDEEREAFARSEYFSLYLHVMNQLEEQPPALSDNMRRQ